MAVGTVSASNTDDIWQLIATNSPSGAASTNFTSISGYKKLMITYYSTFPTADSLVMQFNSDTTNGNYAGTFLLYGTLGASRPLTRWVLSAYPDTETAGYMVIGDTDKTTPKYIEKFASRSMGTAVGVYFGTSAISSIQIYTDSGYTITGTFKLYGVAA
jgi:hypothetical protein